MSRRLRFGVIGIGKMGGEHALNLLQGAVQDATLAAVCDVTGRREAWAKEFLPGIPVFRTVPELLDSGLVDAVLTATPHYQHPDDAEAALKRGLHVLIEKPAGVSVRRVRRLNETARASGNVFGIMYNQRMNPLYRKMRDLVVSGELGAIRRTNWIVTDWYRSQAYYDTGSWRATWAGEGGGVLINQCPHQLDLWQWTTGMMPVRVRAFCHFGKYRNIEVEDEVTAYAEYANGATGVFVTTTGEAPGTNRYEIVGDRGKLVAENGRLTFWRLREPEPAFNARNKEPFASPECWEIRFPDLGPSPEHVGILQNFTDAVLHGRELIAPGEEGILGLSLSNAMHLSGWTDDWAELPLDEDLFEAELAKRIASSTFKSGRG